MTIVSLRGNKDCSLSVSDDFQLDSSLSSNVRVACLEDSAESNNRFSYQMAEVFVYFGWPALVFTTCIIMGSGAIFSILISLLFFLSPVIKGYFGVFISKEGEDPRHKIGSSSFWYDGFAFIGSTPLQGIRQNAALSKSLDIIYNYFDRFLICPKNIENGWEDEISGFMPLNKLVWAWTSFWINMPIAQDVRSRLALVTKILSDFILSQTEKNPGDEVKILIIAGGTKQDAIMASRIVKKKNSGVKMKFVCIEPDEFFSISRSRELMKSFEVDGKDFVDIPKKISTKPEKKQTVSDVLIQNGFSFNEFNMVLCIGLGDYQYGDKIFNFLRMIDNKQTIVTANVSGNFVERPFLHKIIQWPKMQYFSLKKYQGILTSSFGSNRKIEIIQTPHKIFNIAVISPE